MPDSSCATPKSAAYLVIVLSVASLDRLIRAVEDWEQRSALSDRTTSPTSCSPSGLLRWFEDLSDRGIFTTDRSLIVRSVEPVAGRRIRALRPARPSGDRCSSCIRSLADRRLDGYYRARARGRSARAVRAVPQVSACRSDADLPSVGTIEMAQSARIAPLSVDGDVVGTITVIEDVTERVVSERELRNQIRGVRAGAQRGRGSVED